MLRSGGTFLVLSVAQCQGYCLLKTAIYIAETHPRLLETNYVGLKDGCFFIRFLGAKNINISLMEYLFEKCSFDIDVTNYNSFLLLKITRQIRKKEKKCNLMK